MTCFLHNFLWFSKYAHENDTLRNEYRIERVALNGSLLLKPFIAWDQIILGTVSLQWDWLPHLHCRWGFLWAPLAKEFQLFGKGETPSLPCLYTLEHFASWLRSASTLLVFQKSLKILFCWLAWVSYVGMLWWKWLTVRDKSHLYSPYSWF